MRHTCMYMHTHAQILTFWGLYFLSWNSLLLCFFHCPNTTRVCINKTWDSKYPIFLQPFSSTSTTHQKRTESILCCECKLRSFKWHYKCIHYLQTNIPICTRTILFLATSLHSRFKTSSLTKQNKKHLVILLTLFFLTLSSCHQFQDVDLDQTTYTSSHWHHH